jgi:hypothetical protein
MNLYSLNLFHFDITGCIAFRTDLIKKEDRQLVRYFPQQERKKGEERSVPLNPNHNNFILVDDGSVGQFGVEIEFRTRLENELKTIMGIPMVLIVVEGGLGTLNTILLALEGGTPVILVAVSLIVSILKSNYLVCVQHWLYSQETKGCADLVRQVLETEPQVEDKYANFFFHVTMNLF